MKIGLDMDSFRLWYACSVRMHIFAIQQVAMLLCGTDPGSNPQRLFTEVPEILRQGYYSQRKPFPLDTCPIVRYMCKGSYSVIDYMFDYIPASANNIVCL